MRIPEEIVRQISDTADIVEIISENIDLKKTGRNYKGFSPWNNEKTPSFIVSPDKNIFKDFSSGKAGNAVTFLMEYHGLTYIEALVNLANRYGITLPNQQNEKDVEESDKRSKMLTIAQLSTEFFAKYLFSKDGKVAYQYFKKRGYNNEIIEKFSLGAAPDSWNELHNYLINKGYSNEILNDVGIIRISEKTNNPFDYFRNRAIFTIKDFLGRPIGFGARQLNEEDQPKYLNSPQSLIYDKSKVLFGIFEAKNEIRNKGYAIITEGYTDVITLHQYKYPQAVASSGTALTDEQLKLLKRYTSKLFFLYDSDEAGQKATERGIELALQNRFEIFIIRLPKGEDPDSILKKEGKETFDMFFNKAVDFLEYLIDRYEEQGKLSSELTKADSARNLIKLITTIPDKLQHDFYISRISSKLGLSDKQINLLYDEKNHIDKSQDNKVEKTQNDEQNQRVNYNYKDLILNEEHLLLKYALESTQNIHYLFDEYEINKPFFITPLAQKLYQVINDFSEEHNILEAILSADNVNKDIKEFISDIALNEESISQNWKDFGADDLEIDNKKLIKDCKTKIEIKKLNVRIEEIRQKLKENTDDGIEEINNYHILIKEKKRLENEIINQSFFT
jgi:DNA primase